MVYVGFEYETLTGSSAVKTGLGSVCPLDDVRWYLRAALVSLQVRFHSHAWSVKATLFYIGLIVLKYTQN
jgi:hypothetical protein